MQTKAHSTTTDIDARDPELDEELAGILTAISVVSKRLAKKLMLLQRQGTTTEEGGEPDEQSV